jgi:hypothetical protein
MNSIEPGTRNDITEDPSFPTFATLLAKSKFSSQHFTNFRLKFVPVHFRLTENEDSYSTVYSTFLNFTGTKYVFLSDTDKNICFVVFSEHKHILYSTI